MAKRIFLDTNIVADMIDASRVGSADAMDLLRRCVLDDIEPVVSEDMLSTLYYISKDKAATLDFFEHVVFRYWRVSAFGETVVQDAVRIARETGKDLEDMLQCLCAVSQECSVLITGDRTFFACEGIHVMTTREFLDG